jgi:hypothetical protein
MFQPYQLIMSLVEFYMSRLLFTRNGVPLCLPREEPLLTGMHHACQCLPSSLPYVCHSKGGVSLEGLPSVLAILGFVMGSRASSEGDP